MTTITGGGTGGVKAFPSVGGVNSATGIGGNGAYNGISGGGGGAGAVQGGQGGGDSGGDGGIHGYVGLVQNLISATGSQGAAGQYGMYGLDGGGGGAGGYGAVITSSGDLGTITATLTGASGGDGGGSQSYYGGSGGRGGIGLFLNDTSGVSFTLAGSVAGGSGGKAGLGWESGSPFNGYAGAGGEGIYGVNLSITLAGGSVVTGGIGGDGVRAAAIYFESGVNLLDVQGGTIIGDIIGGGVDTLRLSGDTGGAFDMSTVSSFETLESAGTAAWTLTGANSDVQTWTASSGRLLVNGALANTAFVIEADATLGGAGTVGAVTVEGALGPGADCGALTTGNLSFGADGVLEIEIAGTAVGKFDQVTVIGSVSLDGVLDVALLKRFSPDVGDSFTIIANDGQDDAVSGVFDGLAEGAVFTVSGAGFQISYAGGDGNDVVLTTVSLAPHALANVATTLAEGDTITLTAADLLYADLDQTADNLTYKLGAVANGAVLKNGVVLGKGGTFTQDDIDQGVIAFRHDGSETGAASFSFSVSDGQGNTLTDQSYAMTVTGVNDAPTLAATAANAVFTEGQAAADIFDDVSVDTIESGQTITGMTLTVSGLKDGDAEQLTLDGVTIVLKAGAGVTSSGIGYTVSLASGVATVTLTASGLSEAEAASLIDGLAYANTSEKPTTNDRIIRITGLSDDGGGADTAVFALSSTVQVAAVNDAPTDIVVTPPSGDVLTVAENAVGASLGAVTASDVDDSSFTYSVDDVRFEVINGELKLKAGLSLDYEAASSVTIEVTAVDAGNLAVTKSFTVAVADVDESTANAAPILSNPNSDLSLTSGTALSLTVGDGHFRDPEGGDLDYAITVNGAEKPGWLSFDAETGLITGAPTKSQVGSYEIVITASDGALTASDAFNLVITEPVSPIDMVGTGKSDVIVGDASDNKIEGRGGNDTLIGGSGADIIDGGSGSDAIYGGSGKDTVYGGAGADTIAGESGADRINGGLGRDLMSGGGGADRFIFTVATAGSRDTISDFQVKGSAHDVIDISDFDLASYDALKSLMAQSGENTVIRLTHSETIVLTGVDLDDLSKSDFLL
ncbi:cadherin-like domain-containing protein [Rhizobium sp. FKL33]|uniref:cadherin-like domain-containing protein n=1 Tax=Rhizobium sp. FKL33 TaxID=2562307 RepID=UPI0010BFCA4F|nr:cadherin-like domain-containing protein [Rhizobium sp. FKL33]